MPFQKGNTFGRGRPRISLQKPELLLPAVFGKAGVNWQKDFVLLYRRIRDKQPLDNGDKALLNFFETYMPYLCSKVTLKEIEDKLPKDPAGSVAQAKATSKLLQALEAENASKPSTSGD